MSGEAFISIEHVSKHFGSVRAVDDVSLSIERGAFYALLGPSGCGKTTLLRMLGGFEVPTAGEITIDGQPMAAVPPYQRPVNTVFQSYAIFPHLDVFENIAFGLRKERLDKSELTRRVDEALAMIRLQGYSRRGAHELSGGQRQRVALARALIRRPKVLLLDEPLGALDRKLREHMQIELRDLQRSLGTTFVFVTHDQEEALAMSDRIAVMAEGRVVEAGTPAELYARPSTRFVAEFIGLMNFFDGRVVETVADRIVVEAGVLGRVEARCQGEHSTGDRVTLAVRPERVVVGATGAGGQPSRPTGRIRKLSYLGDRTLAHIELAASGPLLLATLVGDLGMASDTIAIGSDVAVSWDAEALIVLSKA